MFAEVSKDSVVRLAPFDRLEALREMDSIQAAEFLGRVRGMVPLDKDAVADLLVELGPPSAPSREIREIDRDPIVIVGGRPVVVDALVL
jgi:hypothetical protein